MLVVGMVVALATLAACGQDAVTGPAPATKGPTASAPRFVGGGNCPAWNPETMAGIEVFPDGSHVNVPGGVQVEFRFLVCNYYGAYEYHPMWCSTDLNECELYGVDANGNLVQSAGPIPPGASYWSGVTYTAPPGSSGNQIWLEIGDNLGTIRGIGWYNYSTYLE
jgi:hypothetical protein